MVKTELFKRKIKVFCLVHVVICMYPFAVRDVMKKRLLLLLCIMSNNVQALIDKSSEKTVNVEELLYDYC